MLCDVCPWSNDDCNLCLCQLEEMSRCLFFYVCSYGDAAGPGVDSWRVSSLSVQFLYGVVLCAICNLCLYCCVFIIMHM